MRSRRGCGSRFTVCIILILLLVGAVCTASIPAPGGNATVVNRDLDRRSDANSPGAQSWISGGSHRSLWDPTNPTPDIVFQDFIDRGKAIGEYLQADDDAAAAALLMAAKMLNAPPLVSTFTDVNAFGSNGWATVDVTPQLLENFNNIVPIWTAIRSLGLSAEARPRGRNECTRYEHTLPWLHDGRRIKSSSQQPAVTPWPHTNPRVARWRFSCIRICFES